MVALLYFCITLLVLQLTSCMKQDWKKRVQKKYIIGSIALLSHNTLKWSAILGLSFFAQCWWPRESMLRGSSTLSELRTSLSKVLTLWHCVEVKQCYLYVRSNDVGIFFSDQTLQREKSNKKVKTRLKLFLLFFLTVYSKPNREEVKGIRIIPYFSRSYRLHILCNALT